MNRYKILLFIFIISAVKVTACEKEKLSLLNDDILDSITIKPLKYGNDSIVLDEVFVIDNQMDSLLNIFVKYLNKRPKMSFYITFMNIENKLYFEVVGGFEDNNFLEYKRKGSSPYLRKGTEIYGFLEHKGVKFYILKYLQPNNSKNDDIGLLFKKSSGKYVIKEKKEGDYFIFTFENPMWLYEYVNGKIILLKSINDEYYFFTP
jgi:hypothetical protein